MAALQLRRGLKANLPTRAAAGEPLIATDTKELYIGAGLLAGDDPVYKISDVLISDVQPVVAGNESKVWINTTTNTLYRVDGASWVKVGGIDQLTDVTLGGATPVDTGVPTQKAVKTYVDNAISALVIPTEWPDSVIDYITVEPVAPVEGGRYLVNSPATGAFTGYENNIATYRAVGGWTFVAPTNGTFISVDSDTTGIYYFGGSNWVKKTFELNSAGPGISITAGVIALNAATIAPTGGGLLYDEVTGGLSIGTIDGGTF